MQLPEVLRAEIEPLLEAMRTIDEQIKQTSEKLRKKAEENEVAKRLCTVPGIGPITAITYLAVLDNV